MTSTAAFLIGAFPPPVHGLAAVNAAVRKAVEHEGAEPRVVNLSPATLKRSRLARLSRLPRVLLALGRFLRSQGTENQACYLSISGGAGQLYEIMFVAVARWRKMRIFMHHHSFAYLDRPSRLTRILACVAGPNATQIALSAGMARLLTGVYGFQSVTVVSNAAVLLAGTTDSPRSLRTDLQTIGFISNISAEKGIFDFIDLVAAAQAANLAIGAIIAGPFQNAEIEERVRSRLRSMSDVTCLGPVYGEAKELFFADIDALVFPTRYVNEAEPLVLHEAMSRGLPVIAFGRGAIPEIVSTGSGAVIAPDAPFIPAALDQLRRWHADPSLYREAASAARMSFSASRANSTHTWRRLLDALTGIAPTQSA